MRQDIKDSIERMATEDVRDVCLTLDLPVVSKVKLKALSLRDEGIAQYVLMY